MNCDHHNRVGDNYGESCMDCEEQLSGYGYGGWFGQRITAPRKCIHVYIDNACMYCEQLRPNLEQRVAQLEAQIEPLMILVTKLCQEKS